MSAARAAKGEAGRPASGARAVLPVGPVCPVLPVGPAGRPAVGPWPCRGGRPCWSPPGRSRAARVRAALAARRARTSASAVRLPARLLRLRRAAPRRLRPRLALVRPAAGPCGRQISMNAGSAGTSATAAPIDGCGRRRCRLSGVGCGGAAASLASASIDSAVASAADGLGLSDGDSVRRRRSVRYGQGAARPPSPAPRRSQPHRRQRRILYVGRQLCPASPSSRIAGFARSTPAQRRTLPAASPRPLSALTAAPGFDSGRRRRRPALDAVAERAEHRGEILAGAAEQRGHRDRDA